MASAQDTPRTAPQASVTVSGAPALRASNLVGGYGERAVLHGVSLAVEPGEMLAIVGPNGAGKSTLLRLLGGSLKPWQGTVELLGAPLASFGQENSVAFSFTVLEVVLMGRAPYLGSFHFESRGDLMLAREALERFDLLALATR